uniref:FAM186A/B C-terminal domain-containing protein n=1 Tax=Varanus komodoensis TaxID=61221 RepID=A0A8D2JEW6_VARKO
MEALRQEQLEKQQQYKKWQQEQEERQKELQRLWKKRWQEQQEKWHHQLHLQKVQLHQCQEKGRKLAEKQQKVKVEVEKSLPPKLKIVVGTSLGQPTKPCKVSPAQTDRQLSTTPEQTPTPSTEFEQEPFELETTVFPKLLPKADEGPVVGTTEKRYSINVEAQRKNLELLKEATQKADIPPDLYAKTEVIIKQALQNNAERLALLFKKYMSLYHLQEARKKITIQLEAAKEANDSIEMQNLYKMVEKLDTHQKKVMGKWMVKQNAVEKKRHYCFEKMITLFTQVRLNCNLCLSSPSPLMVKGGADTQKVQLFLFLCREPSSEQIESLWKTDITELSIPLGPKVPVSLLWSEAYGFPDIPRFLELDISSVRKKPLQNIRTR